MRSIRLTEASPNVHRQLYSAWMAAPFEDQGGSLRSHIQEEPTLTWNVHWTRSDISYADRRGLSDLHSAARKILPSEDLSFMEIVKTGCEEMSRPLLMMSDAAWLPNRATIIPALEAALEAFGYTGAALDRQLDLVRFAGNWSTRILRFMPRNALYVEYWNPFGSGAYATQHVATLAKKRLEI